MAKAAISLSCPEQEPYPEAMKTRQVVLASTPDLQCGYSRDLFVAWCGSAKNSIVLTNRTSPGTLARWLIDNPQDHVVRLE
ncbi:cleavage and polyadenylation specificity factor subunit 2, partial [Plakobranchus ocellatus]